MEDNREEVHKVGHRRFVGGIGDYWDMIGRLQVDFLVARGLTPSDRLIDVACGSLRGGVWFIRYLEPGHYFGVDKHIELIIYGVASELGIESYGEKRPHFVVSDSFEFYKLAEKPSFGIAQSLFTHLCAVDINSCLTNLNRIAAPGCRFFATFFETPVPVTNPTTSHSHGYFGYTRLQMEEFGLQAGWKPNYIGDWNHPRSQKIIEYIAP
jgi:SAM-dependent methyltransferase